MSRIVNEFISESIGTQYEQNLHYCIEKLNSVPHTKVIIYDIFHPRFMEVLIASMITKQDIIIINNKCSKAEAISILLNNHEGAILVTNNSETLSSLELKDLVPILLLDKTISNNKKNSVRKARSQHSFIIHVFDENLKESRFTDEAIDNIFTELYATIYNELNPHVETKIHTCIDNEEDFFLYEIFAFIFNKGIYKCRINDSKRELSFYKGNTNSKKDILFIEYDFLLKKWNQLITDLFQLKFIFRSFENKLVERFIVAYLGYKLKFKGFDKVVILGMPSNELFIKTLSRFNKPKIYNIFGEVNRLMFNSFSDELGMIKINNDYHINWEFRKNNSIFGRLHSPHPLWENDYICSTCYFEPVNIKDKENYAKYCGYIFPLTKEFPHNVESLITKIPFIKDCLLLRIYDENILLYDLNVDILESAHYGLYTIESMLKAYVTFINQNYLTENTKIHRMREIPSKAKRYTRFGHLDRKFLYGIETWWKSYLV